MYLFHYLLFLSSFIPTLFLPQQISFVSFCCTSVLFLHVFLVFIISFNLAFLSFTQFLLLTLPAVPCFFSSCFFILVFTLILLYKRIWAFCGPNYVAWIKRVLGLICLDLSKPFCCRSLSLALLSLGLSCSLVFFVGL